MDDEHQTHKRRSVLGAIGALAAIPISDIFQNDDNANANENDTETDTVTAGDSGAAITSPDIDRIFFRETDPAAEFNVTKRDIWFDPSSGDVQQGGGDQAGGVQSGPQQSPNQTGF